MSSDSSGKGSKSPRQQNDDPVNSTQGDDELEKLKIPPEMDGEHNHLDNDQPPENSTSDEADVIIPLNDNDHPRRYPRSVIAVTDSDPPVEEEEEECGEVRYPLEPRTARDQKRKKIKIKSARQKAREIYREALYNTRDTITLVAVLISTFTYSAGINPPGGVHQEGPLIGTAVAARRTAFRVFYVCNNVALFVSLCIVIVLVSIIPFKRKALMHMMAVVHKAIWVAVSFMATAYVAAAAVITPSPRRHWEGLEWTTWFLVSICVGSLGSVLVGLVILLVKHKKQKREWRFVNRRLIAMKQHMERYVEDDDGMSSIISDMAVSTEMGYHSF